MNTHRTQELMAAALVGAIILAMLALSVQAQQVPIPTTPAEVTGPAPGPMTKAYVQMVGRVAYFWGWPLVYVYNQRTELTKVPEAVLLNGAICIAPMNQLSMLTGYVNPAETYIADPNQDVVYGLGYLSLEKEPVIMQVPDFGDRFWTLPVYDARTDQMSELGRQYDTKPGFYMIVGPNWKGDTPAGINGVIRSSTNFAATMPRIFLNDTAEDHAAIQPLLNQILVYPLSQFDGKVKTKDWSKLPTPMKKGTPAKYSSTQPPWVDPATFFDHLPEVMKQVPPLPGEEALYKWIASVLDAAAKDPEVMKTLQATALAADQELIAPMMQWRYNGQPAGNGWTSPADNGAFGTDYIHRTGAVKADPYDNKRNETMYFYTDNDSKSQQLVGSSMYSVTFAKGQLPPVKGFWSLTMYNPAHFFAANALNRFALGTKNKSLQYNPDGSLTIYFGNKSPGKAKESNWLPAPMGNFSIWLRAYWPDQTILDGTWQPPVIERLAQGQSAAGGETKQVATEEEPADPESSAPAGQTKLVATGEKPADPESEESKTAALAKAAQNPVANLISFPLQNNTAFGIGPYERAQNVLNIQPVIPFHISEKWNLITRTILPVVWQPNDQPTQGWFGFGDLNPSLFLSPAKPGKLIWGVGPAFVFPTATAEQLGQGKFSLGPSVVVLSTPGHWVMGALINNVWSVAGPHERAVVNQMLLQWFVNYNMKKGWYLSTSPIITADWRAPSGNQAVDDRRGGEIPPLLHVV